MKAPWRRGPSRLEQELAAHDASENAILRVHRSKDDAPCADQCERVTTPQGRKAHLRHPRHGVMCGWWASSWHPAGPALPLCRLCVIAALTADEGKTLRQDASESGAAS